MGAVLVCNFYDFSFDMMHQTITIERSPFRTVGYKSSIEDFRITLNADIDILRALAEKKKVRITFEIVDG